MYDKTIYIKMYVFDCCRFDEISSLKKIKGEEKNTHYN